MPRPKRAKSAAPERVIRVAFIGAGGRATTSHYPSIRDIPGAEICAIAELDAEKMRKAAEQFGVKATYADYREMIVENGDSHLFCEWGVPLPRGVSRLHISIIRPSFRRWNSTRTRGRRVSARRRATPAARVSYRPPGGMSTESERRLPGMLEDADQSTRSGLPVPPASREARE